MKKILFSVLIIFGFLSISKGQIVSSISDITINWKCNAVKSQSNGNAVYYTCHYFEDENPHIFSISTTDLTSELVKFDSIRESFIQDFLGRLESGSKGNGGEVIGKVSIGGLKSVQYKDKIKDEDIILHQYTAAFIHHNTAYMINLIGSSENKGLDNSFKKLISNVKLK